MGQVEVIENLGNNSFIRLVQKEPQVKDDERIVKVMLPTTQDHGCIKHTHGGQVPGIYR